MFHEMNTSLFSFLYPQIHIVKWKTIIYQHSWGDNKSSCSGTPIKKPQKLKKLFLVNYHIIQVISYLYKKFQCFLVFLVLEIYQVVFLGFFWKNNQKNNFKINSQKCQMAEHIKGVSIITCKCQTLQNLWNSKTKEKYECISLSQFPFSHYQFWIAALVRQLLSSPDNRNMLCKKHMKRPEALEMGILDNQVIKLHLVEITWIPLFQTFT